jgi:chemotaxis methyl-accepting protein methylase
MIPAVRAAARLLAERTGLRVSGGLDGRLAACVDRAARARGEAAERYVAGLAADPVAFQRLLDCVTVQETAFFRHPEQFAALERHVLPQLQPPVVVWSAGCSNGQEAYSLAMVLADSGCQDWEVLATDISTTALDRTMAARYTLAELSGLPPVRRRWLRQVGELWEVDPALRRRVRVERANLVRPWFPGEPGRCQVVFCRNVLIYLARAEATAFLDRLADWLVPGGLVFLGYSESIVAPAGRLRTERLGDAYVLRQTARPGPRPTTTVALPALPEAGAMVASGEAAAARGDLEAAVGAFRKATYLDPDQPVGHFQLGLALEAAGDARGARRAYAAARAALERCDPDVLEAGLEGWRPSELDGALRAKLGEAREPARNLAPPAQGPGG